MRDIDSIFLWLFPLFISCSLTFIQNRHKAQNEILILSQQDVINQNMLLDIKENIHLNELIYTIKKLIFLPHDVFMIFASLRV